MKKQASYPMKNYSIKKSKAQASIEFSLAFILTVLFLFLSCNIFVWFNRNIVKRQRAYERSRVTAATPSQAKAGKLDFYVPDPQKNPDYKKLNVFAPGGSK